MAVMGKMPVFIRLGDGDEYEIGSISPTVSFGTVPPGGRLAEMSADVDVRTPLAALFREAADEIEKVPDGN